ncbi:alginate export family protein [Gaoshiqia sp. Z1-71]|uniref:alginate export family protein n=1 Tax=Gaoshiqia hydrogeniformans TaxID=3290090 RepID=UPI003BF7E195
MATKKTKQPINKLSSLHQRMYVKTGILLLFFLVTFSSLFAQFKIDAQYRNRFELRDGYQKLAADGSTPAAFISQRTRLLFTYESEELKVKFSPQDVRVWGDEQLASSTGVFGDEASLDLFEAFVEIKTGGAGWLSVGRQQLVYDNQRILGARNWNQNGIAYDALVYKWHPQSWDVHLGASWNSTGENSSDNYYDPARIKALSYVWAKHSLSENWNLSLSHVASGMTRSETVNKLYFRQTTGLYSTYKSGDLSLWGNVYYQFGKSQVGKKVSAVLVDAEAKYKLGKLTPGIGLSYLSGNSKTGTDQDTDHLFNILYGARHRFFGGMDYFRSFDSHTKQGGLADYYLFLDYKLSKKTSLKNTGHYFCLAQTNPTSPDRKNLGYENDLALKHQFAGWGELESGYFFYLPTSSLKTVQGITDDKFSQFLYLQLTVTPSLFKN